MLIKKNYTYAVSVDKIMRIQIKSNLVNKNYFNILKSLYYIVSLLINTQVCLGHF